MYRLKNQSSDEDPQLSNVVMHTKKLRKQFYCSIFSFGLNNFVNLLTTVFNKRLLTVFYFFIKTF